MTATIRPLAVLVAALTVSACGTPGGTVGVVAVGNVARNNAAAIRSTAVTVGLPKHEAPTGSSALSSIPPAIVRVLPFNDERNDQDVEGRTTAAFGVPMGHIRFEPGPATRLGQALVSELRSAGHAVTEGAGGAQVAGAVAQFEMQTQTTLLYWDVIGSLAVSLQFSAGRGTEPGAPIDYRVRCAERTYVWPGEALIAGVMGKCVADFAKALRSDGRAADALRSSAATAMRDAGNALKREAIAAQPRVATDRTYAYPDRRWSVSYPGDWKLDDSDRFVKISRGQAILGIHTFTDVASQSLDEVADGLIQRWERNMQNVNTFKRVSRQRMTLAGDLTAIAIEHHIGTGRVGKTRKVIVLVKDRAYLIDAEAQFASWPDDERDFNRIIGSFRVVD